MRAAQKWEWGEGSTEVGVGEGQHRSGSGVRAAQKREWGEGSTEKGVG